MTALHNPLSTHPKAPNMKKPTPVECFSKIVTSLVRSEDLPDLNMRQMAVLFAAQKSKATFLSVTPLAESLNISKPAVTRALDRLEDLDFAVRYPNPLDGRLVDIQVTDRGIDYLSTLAGFADGAADRRAA